MTDPTVALELSRCAACLARFLPTDGPCPRCGGSAVERLKVSATGTVLASTELMVPPPGVTTPHRLVLVEVAEGVRLLATTRAALPAPGTPVRVRMDGDVYLADPVGPTSG